MISSVIILTHFDRISLGMMIFLRPAHYSSEEEEKSILPLKVSIRRMWLQLFLAELAWSSSIRNGQRFIKKKTKWIVRNGITFIKK